MKGKHRTVKVDQWSYLIKQKTYDKKSLSTKLTSRRLKYESSKGVRCQVLATDCACRKFFIIIDRSNDKTGKNMVSSKLDDHSIAI